MLHIFSVLTETVATVSLSAPPTVAHIYDAEQSTRWPLLDKPWNSAIIISTMVICCLKYPE